jgi:hypothetical protein
MEWNGMGGKYAAFETVNEPPQQSFATRIDLPRRAHGLYEDRETRSIVPGGVYGMPMPSESVLRPRKMEQVVAQSRHFQGDESLVASPALSSGLSGPRWQSSSGLRSRKAEYLQRTEDTQIWTEPIYRELTPVWAPHMQIRERKTGQFEYARPMGWMWGQKGVEGFTSASSVPPDLGIPEFAVVAGSEFTKNLLRWVNIPQDGTAAGTVKSFLTYKEYNADGVEQTQGSARRVTIKTDCARDASTEGTTCNPEIPLSGVCSINRDSTSPAYKTYNDGKTDPATIEVFEDPGDGLLYLKFGTDRNKDWNYNGNYIDFENLGLTSAITVAMVYRIRAVTYSARLFEIGEFNADAGKTIIGQMPRATGADNTKIVFVTPKTPVPYQGNSNDNDITTTTVLDQWYVLVVSFSSTNIQYVKKRLDGMSPNPANENISSTTARNIIDITNTRTVFGKSSWEGDPLSCMDYRDIAVYNSAKSLDDCTTICTQYMNYYGRAQAIALLNRYKSIRLDTSVFNELTDAQKASVEIAGTGTQDSATVAANRGADWYANITPAGTFNADRIATVTDAYAAMDKFKAGIAKIKQFYFAKQIADISMYKNLWTWATTTTPASLSAATYNLTTGFFASANTWGLNLLDTQWNPSKDYNYITDYELSPTGVKPYMSAIFPMTATGDTGTTLGTDKITVSGPANVHELFDSGDYTANDHTSISLTSQTISITLPNIDFDYKLQRVRFYKRATDTGGLTSVKIQGSADGITYTDIFPSASLSSYSLNSAFVDIPRQNQLLGHRYFKITGAGNVSGIVLYAKDDASVVANTLTKRRIDQLKAKYASESLIRTLFVNIQGKLQEGVGRYKNYISGTTSDLNTAYNTSILSESPTYSHNDAVKTKYTRNFSGDYQSLHTKYNSDDGIKTMITIWNADQTDLKADVREFVQTMAVTPYTTLYGLFVSRGLNTGGTAYTNSGTSITFLAANSPPTITDLNASTVYSNYKTAYASLLEAVKTLVDNKVQGYKGLYSTWNTFITTSDTAYTTVSGSSTTSTTFAEADTGAPVKASLTRDNVVEKYENYNAAYNALVGKILAYVDGKITEYKNLYTQFTSTTAVLTSAETSGTTAYGSTTLATANTSAPTASVENCSNVHANYKTARVKLLQKVHDTIRGKITEFSNLYNQNTSIYTNTEYAKLADTTDREAGRGGGAYLDTLAAQSSGITIDNYSTYFEDRAGLSTTWGKYNIISTLKLAIDTEIANKVNGYNTIRNAYNTFLLTSVPKTYLPALTQPTISGGSTTLTAADITDATRDSIRDLYTTNYSNLFTAIQTNMKNYVTDFNSNVYGTRNTSATIGSTYTIDYTYSNEIYTSDIGKLDTTRAGYTKPTNDKLSEIIGQYAAYYTDVLLGNSKYTTLGKMLTFFNICIDNQSYITTITISSTHTATAPDISYTGGSAPVNTLYSKISDDVVTVLASQEPALVTLRNKYDAAIAYILPHIKTILQNRITTEYEPLYDAYDTLKTNFTAYHSFAAPSVVKEPIHTGIITQKSRLETTPMTKEIIDDVRNAYFGENGTSSTLISHIETQLGNPSQGFRKKLADSFLTLDSMKGSSEFPKYPEYVTRASLKTYLNDVGKNMALLYKSVFQTFYTNNTGTQNLLTVENTGTTITESSETVQTLYNRAT